MKEGQQQHEAGAPPPTQKRRPRVREVSSRFMSPSPSSSSGDLHPLSASSPKHQPQRSISAQRRRRLNMDPDPDENIPKTAAFTKSLEAPFSANMNVAVSKAGARNPPPPKLGRISTTRPLKENAGSRTVASNPPPPRLGSRTSTASDGYVTSSAPSRPDTPIASLPSGLRSMDSSPAPALTAAAKLLQASGLSLSAEAYYRNQATTAPCPPQLQLHSSMAMPETSDTLPTISGRLLAVTDKKGGSASSTFSPSPCFRSLNLPPSTLSKPYAHATAAKKGFPSLPPVPSTAKLSASTDTKMGKSSNYLEDLHALRLLYSRYLQWRFANAKAQASMQAQKKEAQKALHSIAVKISDLYDSVKKKRIELQSLQNAKNLLAIVEAQMPYLAKWSDIEGDYSFSLSEVIQALLNACLQLPISGNVKANTEEVGEVMNSATMMMETIVSHVQKFLPKADKNEIIISELARTVGGERAFLGECGEFLSKMYKSQVEECSLRAQLIQLHERKPS